MAAGEQAPRLCRLVGIRDSYLFVFVLAIFVLVEGLLVPFVVRYRRQKRLRNGRRTMPAVGSGWTDEQMKALTVFLQESPPSGG